MEWVKEGVRVSGYPGWSRVAIVINRRRHDQLRDQYWFDLADFDHRVYTMRDIQMGRFTSLDTAYRLDDLNEMLFNFFPGLNIDGFTITATTWETS
jgi:hypothetical protein